MARSNRLDTPREARRSLRPKYDPETFGRLSERFARFFRYCTFLGLHERLCAALDIMELSCA